MQTPIELSYLNLVNALSLLLLVLASVRAFGLGLEREYLIASLRAIVQLSLLGTVLSWIFAHQSAWLVLAVLCMFVVVSTYTALGRQREKRGELLWQIGVSLSLCA